jgi:hypothetical protein
MKRQRVSSSRFWAVIRGPETGIFDSYKKVNELRKGYKCFIYKGFETREEAEIWFAKCKNAEHKVEGKVVVIKHNVICTADMDRDHYVNVNIGIGQRTLHQFHGEIYSLKKTNPFKLYSTHGLQLETFAFLLRNTEKDSQVVCFTNSICLMHGLFYGLRCLPQLEIACEPQYVVLWNEIDELIKERNLKIVLEFKP